MPTISFHLGTKERGGRVKKKLQRMMGEIPIVYLYGTSFSRETEQEKKKRFYFLLYCQDERFIVSIKKKEFVTRILV